MIPKTHKWLFLLLLALLPGLTGCIMEENEPVYSDTELCLMLSVSVQDPGGSPEEKITRADDDTYFQLPVLNSEKLQTLRVVIMEKDTRKILYNQYENIIQPTLSYSGMRYKVEFSTDYVIYLIGNERGFPGIDAATVFNSNLRPGSIYSDRSLEDLIISSSETGAPVIDNTGAETTIIPMCEKFEIHTIDHPHGEIQYIPTMDLDLFLTRAVSKFSFNLFKSEDYVGDNQLQIKGIRITGLGKSEYLMPNDTEYVPGKYEPTDNEYGGRLISSFSVPGGNPVGKYDFSVPFSVNVADLPVRDAEGKNTGRNFSPQLYFPESIGNDGTDKFQCSITFDGINYLPAITLPNLPSLPRNSHVIVNLTVGNNGALLFNIAVLPWNTFYHEVDFTHNVGIAEDGALTLETDTYASFDKANGRVVLRDYPQATYGSFGISSPLGARWYAYLITTGGEMNQIQFEVTDDEGNTTTSNYITGIIDGKKTNFRVVSTSAAAAEPRTAILQVMVTMNDGLSVPVNILKSSDYGPDLENITFIQNQQ